MNKTSDLIKVEFIYLPVINFALQQNRVSVIRLFTIENISGKTLHNIQVWLEAEPAFAETVPYRIEEISANEIVRINDLKPNLSTDFFIRLTERLAGHLFLKIAIEETILFQETYPIDILAFDQWSGVSVLPEMLSAFVTPNHPAIRSIQKRAADILEQLTGSSALDEYQSRNPNRVKSQMAAVYTAIAEQEIIYSSVPASFEAYGQRIRLVDNVLSQKIGTCLDMALLYATCLEAIGIHPLIIVTQGHAFVGAWLVPDTFPDSVTDDCSFLTKRTAEGINEILLLEATCMNKGNDSTFDQAINRADDHIKRTDNFILALDVKRSRFSGINPLPQRVLNGEHWEIDETGDTTSEKKIIQPTSVNPYDLSNLSTTIQVTKQLMWERKLLDLSLRNNLLNMRITKNTLQLMSTDLDKFEDALADGSEFRLLSKPADWDNPLYDFGIYHSIESSDPMHELLKAELTQKRLRTYLTDLELDKSLKHLYRSSRLSIEENGANTLYLAFGLLRWYETSNSERPRYAPLLLFPVEMIRKSAAQGYIIRSREEDAMLNITLLEMLRQNFGINVSGLDPLPQDESGVNIRLIYSIFRDSIKNQPKWDVEEQAILGIFSFNKFIMWNDIHNNADKLMENKLVRSLINGKIEFEVDDSITDASELDKTLTPADIVLPINADSSQLEAIYEAINDKTYILHGPPGTGKSQTITNIIANALYHGKRVLFVAEKMAALSVVQNRLEAIGLAPFCLELHSNKAKKTAVLSQLKTTTEIVKHRSPENFNREAKRLFDLRKELSVYIEALHHSHPFGISLYQAITKYSLQKPDYEVAFPQALLPTLSEDKLLEWQDTIDLLVSVGNACGHPYQHPLSKINLLKYTPEVKDKATTVLNHAIKAFTDFRSSIPIVRTIVNDEVDTPYTKEQINEATTFLSVLLQIPELTNTLLYEQRPDEVFAECQEVISHGKERDRLKLEITRFFDEDIRNIHAKSLLNDWLVASSKWFIPRYFEQKKVRNQLKPYIHTGSIKQIDIKQTLTNLIKYQDEHLFVKTYTEKLQSLFGRFAKPENEQWEKIQQIIDDFTVFSAAIIGFTKSVTKANRLKDHLSEQLVGGIDLFRKINESAILAFINQLPILETSASEVSKNLQIAPADLQNKELTWMDDALSDLHKWLSNIDRLKDWYQWLVVKRKANELQLGFVAETYEIQNIPTHQLKSSFYKGFYHAVIDYIIQQEPNLSLFKGQLFNDVISKYKKLTADFTAITKNELYAKLAANIPSFTIAAAYSSEIGILQRNIKSNGRGTSIRSLFDQIPTLLSRMCPCMLMSPISVAQYIHPEADKFDLIIFDEASQMPTNEAIGAIARGKNMIIVGDPKQMPPTNFFAVNMVDEDNLDKEDLESILDDSLALSIPSRHLLWHYRSKHESLIAFSNAEYYENKLLTFPSPDNIESKVRLVYMNGIYDKGKSRQNRQEAVAIVKEIERRLSDQTQQKKSIGVVTFSVVQQHLIEDLLSDLFILKPDLESIALECEEPLFIKNLENVQGDERDIILFSVGYGPDRDGRVSMNFGPLNRVGGERRLNVAVSRARYEMTIFSTLRSDQIDLNRTSAIGVAGLKRFLEFAEKGERLTREKLLNTTETESIECIIATRLREVGHEVHVNIGASGYKIDMAVVDEKNPGKYILGIICDGDNYKRTKTTRDREIVQSSVLQLLGWNICRVWTLDWWENPQEVLHAIENAIEKAKNGITDPSPAERNEEKKNIISGNDAMTHDDPVQTASSDVKKAYTCAILEPVTMTSDNFFTSYNKKYIFNQIRTILETEAPISRALLCKRILSAWHISRLGPRIETHFDILFKNTYYYYKKTTHGRTFFWKNREQMLSYQIFRPISERTASDLPPEEVANAIKYVVASQISLPIKDLSRMTAQLFGFARIGTHVDFAIDQGIHEAIQRDYIKIENGRAFLL